MQVTQRPGRIALKDLVALGCAYELLALYSHFPTITALTHRTKNSGTLGRLLVWAAMGGVVWHFFVEQPSDD